MHPRMHAILLSVYGIARSPCATGIVMSLCRSELVPEVKRAYEQLGGWMKPGQLPLVYHPVYNIGMSNAHRLSCVGCRDLSTARYYLRPVALCAVSNSQGRTCVFAYEPTTMLWLASSM